MLYLWFINNLPAVRDREWVLENLFVTNQDQIRRILIK